MKEIFLSRYMQEYKQRVCILALCCVLSAAFGVLFAATVGNPYILLMHMSLGRPVSIVGLTVSVFVPYLISFLVVVHSKPWLVYFVIGLRIALTSSVGWAIARSFSGASWLVRLLMQWPDLCLIPALIFLYCFTKREFARTAALRFILLLIGVGVIYYCIISPFLVELIDSYETMGRYAIHVGLDRRL